VEAAPRREAPRPFERTGGVEEVTARAPRAAVPEAGGAERRDALLRSGPLSARSAVAQPAPLTRAVAGSAAGSRAWQLTPGDPRQARGWAGGWPYRRGAALTLAADRRWAADRAWHGPRLFVDPPAVFIDPAVEYIGPPAVVVASPLALVAARAEFGFGAAVYAPTPVMGFDAAVAVGPAFYGPPVFVAEDLDPWYVHRWALRHRRPWLYANLDFGLDVDADVYVGPPAIVADVATYWAPVWPDVVAVATPRLCVAPAAGCFYVWHNGEPLFAVSCDPMVSAGVGVDLATGDVSAGVDVGVDAPAAVVDCQSVTCVPYAPPVVYAPVPVYAPYPEVAVTPVDTAQVSVVENWGCWAPHAVADVDFGLCLDTQRTDPVFYADASVGAEVDCSL
jgi:hypothetical protein